MLIDMDAENCPDVSCLIVTRFIPGESSTSSKCEDLHNVSDTRCESDQIRNKISSLVRRAFYAAVDKALDADLRNLIELGKATVSFDCLTGIYTVTNIITPQRVANKAVKAIGTEAMYRLVNNKTWLRDGICRHVNAYLRSHKKFDGMIAKVGIHSFDELASLCEEDQN